MRFHFSAVILRNGSKPSRPALLTRMVGRPSRWPDVDDAAVDLGPVGHVDRQADGGATGGHDLGGGRRRRRRRRGRRWRRRSPSAARRSAMASPMPEPPPVTTATRVGGHWIASSPLRVVRCMSRGDVGVVPAGPVQDAPVVPDDHVADRPLVPVDPVGGGRAGQQIVEQRPALVVVHADHVGRRSPRAPASADPTGGVHTSGCSFDGRDRHTASSSGDGSSLTRRWDASMVWTTRSDAQALLLVVGEVVVGRVGAGELGLAPGLGDRVGAQHRGHDRDVVGAAVDVPVERPPQVGGRPGSSSGRA